MKAKIGKHKGLRKKLVTGLSAFVVFCTTYALILPAITLSANAGTYCNKDEHIHSDECYQSSQPLCGQDEGLDEGHVHGPECYEQVQNLICGLFEDGEFHIHDDSCYQTEEKLICNQEERPAGQSHTHDSTCYRSQTPLCGKEEHQHSRQCESNPDEVETEEEWTEKIPEELDEDPLKAVLQVANSQLGYKESTVNFQVVTNEDGEEIEKGYTRYGDWAGDRYGDWNKYFTGFVLYHSSGYNLFDTDTYQWLARSEGNLKLAKEGDVVFFNHEDKLYTGIVKKINRDSSMKIVAGDMDNKVREFKKTKEDIYGVALLTDRTEEIDSSAEESEKPSMPEPDAEDEDDLSGNGNFIDSPAATPPFEKPQQPESDLNSGSTVSDQNSSTNSTQESSSANSEITSQDSMGSEGSNKNSEENSKTPGNLEMNAAGNLENSENTDKSSPENSTEKNDSTSEKNPQPGEDDVETPEKEAEIIGYVPEEGALASNEKEILDANGNPYLKQTARDDKELIEVTVYYPLAANIPENAILKATHLETDESGNHKFDIGFYDEEGTEHEPEARVKMKIVMIGEDAEKSKLTEIQHYKNPDEIEVFSLEKDKKSRMLQSEFDLESFSMFVTSGPSTLAEEDGNTITLMVDETHIISGNRNNYYSHEWSIADTSIAKITSNNNRLTVTVQGLKPGQTTLTHIYTSYYGYSTTETFTIIVQDTTRKLNLFDVKQSVTPSCNKNGFSTVEPAIDSYNLETGQTITLPATLDKDHGDAIFAGWSNVNNYTGTGSDHLLGDSKFYPPGSQFVMPSGTDDCNLFAVWAYPGKSVMASFFIQLNGIIPNEPIQGNVEGGTKKNYTYRMDVNGAIKSLVFYYDRNGIKVGESEDARLAAQPTPETIAEKVNERNVTSEGSTVPIKLVAHNGKLYLARSDDNDHIKAVYRDNDNKECFIEAGPKNDYYAQQLESSGIVMEVSWYVFKNTSSTTNTGPTENPHPWHVDGVLKEKNQLKLIYDPNETFINEVQNMPDGKYLNPGTTVYVGYSQNIHQNNALRIPTRTGYTFLGWSLTKNGPVKYNGLGSETFEIKEDTTLYAVWSRGTNELTVQKEDMNGNILSGAQFTLEEKKNPNDSFSIISQSLTTNEKGVFTFNDLENITIYRLTETYAPNGYEKRNSFCFKVDVDPDDKKLLNFYLCKEDGSALDHSEEKEIEQWVTFEYSQNDAKLNIELVMKDELIMRDAIFKKVDSDSKPLSGAAFKLQKYGIDENLEDVQILNSSPSVEDGVFSTTNAEIGYGTYLLTEIETPSGYVTVEPIQFTINDSKLTENELNQSAITVTGEKAGIFADSDNFEGKLTRSVAVEGGVTKITYSYEFNVKNVKAPKLTIRKTDESEINPLPGAEFILTKTGDDSEDFKPIESITGQNGLIELPVLDKGTYVLEETKAPDGYNLMTEEITITVNSDGTLSVSGDGSRLSGSAPNYILTIPNSSGASLPNTGGSGTNLMTFGGSAAIFGSLLMFGYSKRQQKRKEEVKE